MTSTLGRAGFEYVMFSALALILGSHTRVDPDLWGHLRFGLDILTTMSLPAADPYSFTADVPWVNHEWLAEAFMAAAWQGAGVAGLVLLKIALLGGTALLVHTIIPRDTSMLRRAAPLLVVAAATPWMINLRPQNFSFVLFAGLLVVLCRSRAQPWVLWLAPALFALWINLHGGWLVGGLVLAAWALATCIWPPANRQWRVTPLVVGALSLAATLLNPYGWRMWRFLYETVGFGRDDISDWQAIYRQDLPTQVLWLLSVAVSALAVGRRLSPGPVTAVLLVLCVASFRVGRITAFLALSAVMLALPLLVNAAGRRKQRPPLPRQHAVGGIAACVLITIVATFWSARCVRMRGEWLFDAQTSRAVMTLPPGRILTYFDWGEYVIWHRGRALLVSMDGRRETVYSESVQGAHDDFYRGGPGAAQYPDSIGADYIWLPVSSPVINELLGSWRVVARGSHAVLLGRQSDAFSLPSQTSLLTGCFPGP